MFLGEYSYALDDRGRVAIPTRFREEFKDGLILARGMDRCITAYSPTSWQKLIGQLEGLPFMRGDARRLQRAIFAGAFEAELDRQGRVLIPAPLREYAGIRQEVAVVGTNDHLELWDQENWAQERVDLDNQLAEIAERLNG